MDNLCCPECEHTMPEEEWEKLKDEDGMITCPQCEEDIHEDDLLSDDSLEDED